MEKKTSFQKFSTSKYFAELQDANKRQESKEYLSEVKNQKIALKSMDELRNIEKRLNQATKNAENSLKDVQNLAKQSVQEINKGLQRTFKLHGEMGDILQESYRALNEIEKAAEVLGIRPTEAINFDLRMEDDFVAASKKITEGARKIEDTLNKVDTTNPYGGPF